MHGLLLRRIGRKGIHEFWTGLYTCFFFSMVFYVNLYIFCESNFIISYYCLFQIIIMYVCGCTIHINSSILVCRYGYTSLSL